MSNASISTLLWTPFWPLLLAIVANIALLKGVNLIVAFPVGLVWAVVCLVKAKPKTDVALSAITAAAFGIPILWMLFGSMFVSH